MRQGSLAESAHLFGGRLPPNAVCEKGHFESLHTTQSKNPRRDFPI